MYEGQLAETVRFPGHNGDEIEAYYARPLGPGPYPSVLVIHHMPGWDEPSKEIARTFAHHGYAAICPHLFSRIATEGMSATEASAASRASGGVPDEEFVGDAAGAIAYLRSQAYTTDKVGAIGYCTGGRQAYIAAAKLPVDASIDCYGARVEMSEDELSPERPVAPIDMTPDISCPILLMFGADDANPNEEHRITIEAALTAAGKVFESVTYEDAGHAFFTVDSPNYRVAAANAGWAKIFEFFGEQLDQQN